ncbi:hypothetical protein [Pseudonocardia sp.]|uniref:hypothetical protein n=1 Tax=Pseudonocardia sp. TaxID=60912 RepID=UPI002629139D|nr:hypothetical protein [Pseudonocardia sp.]
MTEGERLLSGRYRIDALLGRGGMSEVHHGYDERLDRPVAIKMLRQPIGDVTGEGPEALELLDAQQRDRARFLREIRTAPVAPVRRRLRPPRGARLRRER